MTDSLLAPDPTRPSVGTTPPSIVKVFCNSSILNETAIWKNYIAWQNEKAIPTILGDNPFRAPKSLSILSLSKIAPKKGIQL